MYWRCRFNTCKFVLCGACPPQLGPAVGCFWPSVDCSIRPYGSRRVACLACQRVSCRSHITNPVFGAARDKRAVELAFLRLALWGPGIRRHSFVVVAHRYNIGSFLACSAVGGRTAHPLPAVGQLCLRTLLFRVATQPTISGLITVRLWSLHPKYLDAKGLVALWREALLAKAVLRGETRGYINHPQLERFREHPRPRSAINAYLAAIQDEATARGYKFNRAKVGPVRAVRNISVTSGQLAYEWRHLQNKLADRSPAVHSLWAKVATPACHPLFRCKPGGVASWERVPGGT